MVNNLCKKISNYVVFPLLLLVLEFGLYKSLNKYKNLDTSYLIVIQISVGISAICLCVLYNYIHTTCANTQSVKNQDDIDETAVLIEEGQSSQINEQTYPECCICWDRIQNTRLGCGHANMCKECAHEVWQKFGICPTCAKPITRIQSEIYTDLEYWQSGSSVSDQSE